MTTGRAITGLTLLALVLYWILASVAGPWRSPIHILASLLIVFLAIIFYLGLSLSRGTRPRGIGADVKYRALAESSPDCLLVHKGDRILFANRAAVEFFKIENLPKRQRTFLSRLLEPDCAERIAGGPEFKLSPAGQAAKMETRLTLHDGSPRDVALTTTLFPPEGEDVLMTFVRDTSEQAAIRRDLFTSRESLRLALNAAQDGAWDWDILTGKMVYGGAWAKMLGYTLDQIQPDGTTWGNLMHPDDLVMAEDLIEAHLKGEIPVYECEVRLRHRDGHYVWVMDRGQVVARDDEGQPVRMAGTHRDITARKEAEFALEFRNKTAEIFLTGNEREIFPQILQLVCDSMESPAGLIGILDRKGEIQPMAAIPPVEPDGDPEAGPAFLGNESLPSSFQESVSKRKPIIIDKPRKSPDDPLPWSRSLTVPIMHRDQVLGAILVADRDPGYELSNLDFLISLASYLAPTLQSYLESESKEAQLRKAQKMEALGALAGGIAHDFNNILQAVMGFTALARDEIPAESIGRQDLDRVMGAAQRGKNLVERILLFSRREEQVHRPVSATAIVNEALELLRPTIPTSIKLDADVQADAGLILADASQISQVVMNLATNAFHALEDTGGTMTIRLQALAANQTSQSVPESLKQRDLVLLAVEDDGTGMDQVTQDRLFDPFFTSKPVNKGTGLGLSVVHGIVTSHGGEILINSQLGIGTRVSIYLPRISAPLKTEVRPFTEAATQLADKKILFVDDEKDLARLGHSLLAKLGCDVISETESPRALAWLTRNFQEVDLVVTDLTMPDLSGLQLAVRILKLRPDLPVILTTGNDETLVDPGEAGPAIKGILRKPFNIEELHNTICMALAEEGPQGLSSQD